jgi:hypothetical protein
VSTERNSMRWSGLFVHAMVMGIRAKSSVVLAKRTFDHWLLCAAEVPAGVS